MGYNITYNGTGYTIPASGETGWGVQTSNYLVDLGNSAVNLNTIQTLTNKTLTSPTITGPTMSGGGSWTGLVSLGTTTLLSQNYAVDSGSLNTYVITLSPAPTSYTAGFTIAFKASSTNTGASTINVNGLGAITIQASGTTIPAGTISSGNITQLIYDGTYFQVSSGVGGFTKAAAIALYYGL